MNRVAFSLPDVGLREIRGLAFIEEGFLVLRLEDSFVGLVDRRTHVVKIAPSALTEVRIKKGMAKHRLVLRPNRSELLDVVPGEHPVALELRVKKKYWRELERLVDEFEDLVAGGGRPHDAREG